MSLRFITSVVPLVTLFTIAQVTHGAEDDFSPIGVWLAQLKEKDTKSGIVERKYIITENQMQLVVRRDGKKESTTTRAMSKKDGIYYVTHEGRELRLVISKIDNDSMSLAIDVLQPYVLIRAKAQEKN